MKRTQSRFSDKINSFKIILKEIATLSVAQKMKVASMAVKMDFSKIASFGYNGTYPSCPINSETGGEEISLCPGESGFLHAEDNMISKFRENDPEKYMILQTLSPCRDCTMRLVNAGFKHVYWINEYRETDHLEIFDRCGVKYGTIKNLINNGIS